MTRTFHRRDRAAILLLALTCTGVALTIGGGAAFAGGALLMAIAVIKARLVVLDYFGFRGAPGPWRAILIAWVAVVATASLASPVVQLIR